LEREEKMKVQEELLKAKNKKQFSEKDNKALKAKVSQLEIDLERTSKELTQFESEKKL
jgi:hypothetical protein